MLSKMSWNEYIQCVWISCITGIEVLRAHQRMKTDEASVTKAKKALAIALKNTNNSVRYTNLESLLRACGRD